MNCVSFVNILIGLSGVLFSCEGRIISPVKGEKFIFLPGSTGNLTWKFDDDIPSLFLRAWYFTRSGGTTLQVIATIADDNNPKIRPSSLSGVDVVKPATLLLKNVNQSYNGVYRFLLAGSSPVPVIAGVQVFIAKKPDVILNCSSSVAESEGDDITCVCRGVGGNPPADVVWFKDGVQIGETATKNKTLTLKNVDETDSGEYVCLAQSYPDPLYEDRKTIVVQIKFKPKETSIKFSQNPVTSGNSVVIFCESRGLPQPSYTITLNGTTVSTGKTHTIGNVKLNDAGIYSCTARNTLGSDSDVDFLHVTEKEPTTPPGRRTPPPRRTTTPPGRRTPPSRTTTPGTGTPPTYASPSLGLGPAP